MSLIKPKFLKELVYIKKDKKITEPFLILMGFQKILFMPIDNEEKLALYSEVAASWKK